MPLVAAVITARIQKLWLLAIFSLVDSRGGERLLRTSTMKRLLASQRPSFKRNRGPGSAPRAVKYHKIVETGQRSVQVQPRNILTSQWKGSVLDCFIITPTKDGDSGLSTNMSSKPKWTLSSKDPLSSAVISPAWKNPKKSRQQAVQIIFVTVHCSFSHTPFKHLSKTGLMGSLVQWPPLHTR